MRQVGAACHAWRCNSAAIPAPGSSPSTWAGRCARRCWGSTASTTTSAPTARSRSSRSPIDQEGYRAWAAEWIEGRLIHEGIAVGPGGEGSRVVGARQPRQRAVERAHADGPVRAPAVERAAPGASALRAGRRPREAARCRSRPARQRPTCRASRWKSSCTARRPCSPSCTTCSHAWMSGSTARRPS